MTTLQHVNVRIFAAEDAGVDLGDAIAVFHGWIQKSAVEGDMLIDIADYRHVPHGPGVLLVGHNAHYSLGSSGGRLSFLYNRRTVRDGSARENLRDAFQQALAACRRLEREAPFAGKLRFDAGDCEIFVNDRLLAPNTDETYRVLRPELEALLEEFWGAGNCEISRAGEPRELFRVAAKARAPVA